MKFPEAFFKICEENSCPLYELGDEFRVSGKTLLLESENDKKFISTSIIKIATDKSVCRILAGDLTSVLIKHGSIESIPKYTMNCSGCTGWIRLEYDNKLFFKEKELRAGSPVEKYENDVGFATKLLNKFPIFQTLNEVDIKKLIPMLKMKKYPSGSTIIEKGDPGSNLFIILSGKAEVLVDEGICINVMERGDVFGEISLLIGTPVGATIKVVELVTVLFIYGKDFKKVLNMFPSMQMYFARLLAQRLAKTNVERLEEFTSGMVGKLSDNPPSELLQTLNLNHKTGILSLTLPKGPAEVGFREGGLVSAQYGEKKDSEAFFVILKEKEGRFKFTPGLPDDKKDSPELGDFMWLLMEGTRRMDEDDNP
ncbi:MAG: DUF4388 domain-containing protein [Desulfobacterales bacterium]|nr:DUF4388 domain-containing protein [Desulfobacterales bacterium]